jgi:hypothetical protein
MMPGPPKPWIQPETQYIRVRNVFWASGKGPFLPWGRAQGAQGGTGGHRGPQGEYPKGALLGAHQGPLPPPKPWIQPETQYISSRWGDRVRNVFWAPGKGPFLPQGRPSGTGALLKGHFGHVFCRRKRCMGHQCGGTSSDHSGAGVCDGGQHPEAEFTY